MLSLFNILNEKFTFYEYLQLYKFLAEYLLELAPIKRYLQCLGLELSREDGTKKQVGSKFSHLYLLELKVIISLTTSNFRTESPAGEWSSTSFCEDWASGG